MARLSGIRRCLKISLKLRTLALILSSAMPGQSQKIATLEIDLDHPTAGIQVPVQLVLDPITHLPNTVLSLVEVRDKKSTPVPFQITEGIERKITWLVQDDRRRRVFELVKRKAAASPSPRMRIEKEDGAITVKTADRALLRYHYETVYPPAGIDTVFKRSAFIHPLWSPRGQVLTRIQPPDHYHHYGLWNPWTHVLFEGDTVDFWNLNARQGTVRFADLISLAKGDIFGEYSALHEHVVFGGDGSEKIALREIQTVRVYAPEESGSYYIADITVEMNCPGSPVRLLEYRYGGMGWRATETWTKENSAVVTSEGKSRRDADGSKARWCIVQGTVGGHTAGAVMMSYPANFNHPEPLRIWPENANRNRGDMFANFSPTKDMDWPLEPETTYVLKYRFIVFDGTFTKEKAEAGWHYFASPPLVRVVKN